MKTQSKFISVTCGIRHLRPASPLRLGQGKESRVAGRFGITSNKRSCFTSQRNRRGQFHSTEKSRPSIKAPKRLASPVKKTLAFSKSSRALSSPRTATQPQWLMLRRTQMSAASYWKRADGSLEAKSVKLGQKTEAETSKPKKKKEKADSESTASPAPTAKP